VKRVSGKRLARLLERRGWRLKRTSGSHHRYAHSDYADNITVPIHANRTLRIGMQIHIMKTAGIREDEL